MHLLRVCTLTVLSTICAAPAALGQTTYYLRQSTSQQGCFIGCACLLTLKEPLTGSFVLTPSTPDPVFQNYTISNANFLMGNGWNQTFAGNGTYQVGGDPAALERMQLDLTVNAAFPHHWDSGHQAPSSPAPAIHSVLTINNYQCYDIELTINATPFRSDWNADGAINIDDVFAFVNDWFNGKGDANGDGTTNLGDVFAFVIDWFNRT